MSLHTFCGVLTLQVGVAMLAIIIWAIAYLTFIVNFFDFFEHDKVPEFAVSISLFVMLMVLAGTLAFFSAFNEDQKLCMAGVAILFLTLAIWITMTLISFLNDPTIIQYVCVREERCPESFWMAPLRYRMLFHDIKTVPNKDATVNPFFVETSPTESTTSQSTTADITTRSTPKPYSFLDNDLCEGSTDMANCLRGSTYIFGAPLIGAVFLFICNLLFFLFTILVLWSYGQEISWTDRCMGIA